MDAAAPTAPPLAGVRVLDLTRYLAGPFATMLLADYGADVIKVEARKQREFQAPGGADSYFFLSANRNKRSLTLDLARPEGRDVLRRLLPHFDVLVENFRPGVMGKLGFAAEELTREFPRLIYCGISGFGAEGPYSDRPGFDQIAQGMSGFMSLTGTVDSGPTRAGIAIADLLGGIFAAQGIQLALIERGRSGRGQIVNTSLLEAMISVLSWGAGMYFDAGRAPGPAGQHHPLSSPYGRFRARDGFLNIAAGNEAMWRKLADVLAQPQWLSDARFVDNRERVRHRDELTREIEAVLAAGDVPAWVEKLNAAGVPSGPVLDLAQVFSDPQVLAREMLVELPMGEGRTFKTTGLPIKLARSPGSIDRVPPKLGEHTGEVLRQHGWTDAEIDGLRARQIV